MIKNESALQQNVPVLAFCFIVFFHQLIFLFTCLLQSLYCTFAIVVATAILTNKYLLRSIYLFWFNLIYIDIYGIVVDAVGLGKRNSNIIDLIALLLLLLLIDNI